MSMSILRQKLHIHDSAVEEQMARQSPAHHTNQFKRADEMAGMPSAATRLDGSSPQNILNLQRLIGNRATIDHLSRQTAADERQTGPDLIQPFRISIISSAKEPSISRKWPKTKKSVDGTDKKKKGYSFINVDTIKSYTDEMIKLYQAIDSLEEKLDNKDTKKERREKISEEIRELKYKGVKISIKFNDQFNSLNLPNTHTIHIGLRALFKIKVSQSYRDLAKKATNYFGELRQMAANGEKDTDWLRIKLFNTKYGKGISYPSLE